MLDRVHELLIIFRSVLFNFMWNFPNCFDVTNLSTVCSFVCVCVFKSITLNASELKCFAYLNSDSQEREKIVSDKINDFVVDFTIQNERSHISHFNWYCPIEFVSKFMGNYLSGRLYVCVTVGFITTLIVPTIYYEVAENDALFIMSMIIYTKGKYLDCALSFFWFTFPLPSVIDVMNMCVNSLEKRR